MKYLPIFVFIFQIIPFSPQAQNSKNAELTILASEGKHTISRHIYGHFQRASGKVYLRRHLG